MRNNNADQTPTFVPKILSSGYDLYLSGEILDSTQYTEWFDLFRSIGIEDVIRVHINSYGGDMFTTIQFMKAMSECAGHIICSAEGACMSAATFIFLSGDMFDIAPHSMFMFHNYSGVVVGKGGEMYDNITHERQWSENILRENYSGFLTEKEIKDVLNNKDIWMDDKEVSKRLDKYIKSNQKSWLIGNKRPKINLNSKFQK